MIFTHVLGFPRIGDRRQLKFALERYWRGEIDLDALETTGARLREDHWARQRQAGLDWVTVGDFAFYDQVLDHIQWFGCAPRRFDALNDLPAPARGFAMARGAAPAAALHEPGCRCGATHDRAPHALEMTKWFDTNYHYLVPEFHPDTTFTLSPASLLAQVRQAHALGHRTKVALIGPMTFLWLGKEKAAGFDRLALLDRLLPAYAELLGTLAAAGVDWVQLDEPILGTDLPGAWQLAFEATYHALRTAPVSLMVATYFSPLEDHISLACRLPVAALHVDAVRAGHELQAVLDWLPPHRALSVGVIDGRNIWRTDLDGALAQLRTVLERRDTDLWIAPSCSLLHVPYALSDDKSIDPEVRGWLAGANEKLDELRVLRATLVEGEHAVRGELFAARAALAARRSSARVRRASVASRMAALPGDIDRRPMPAPQRRALQRARLALPAWPTTTIGSFPQTPAIRAARSARRRGELAAEDYRAAMAEAIAQAVREQEALGLDVLVHGEAERNDMVEYFGEQLEGFAFSAEGWVQSYGSRCVKPPILFGDVERRGPMTVDWTRYAQSLTERPMKGMLTGPVTLLQWSFARDDQPRAQTAAQLALALRDEVRDLADAGIAIVQVDEPALREGLPLRRARWGAYLDWATRAFRIAAAGADNATQIHTHMCYAEFNDILPGIVALDADVLTLEASRSAMDLLDAFGADRYPNDIGPGVYDIHSPRVPTVLEMVELLRQASRVVPPERLWVNPDCGLKTRDWPETIAALGNMVAAARTLRAQSA